jgi:hypothetical protein
MPCDRYYSLSGSRVGSPPGRREVPITSHTFSTTLGAVGKCGDDICPGGVKAQSHHSGTGCQECLCWVTQCCFTPGFLPKVCSTGHRFPGMEFGDLLVLRLSQDIQDSDKSCSEETGLIHPSISHVFGRRASTCVYSRIFSW